jgi:fumarate hydratase, class I
VTTAATGPEFHYSDLLPTAGSNGADETPYRLITTEGVSTVEVEGRTFLKVEPEAIRRLTDEAMHDISHYLRPAHLAQLRKIIDDPEASGNDRFVASTCSRTSTSPPAACCRCARTPAPRS